MKYLFTNILMFFTTLLAAQVKSDTVVTIDNVNFETKTGKIYGSLSTPSNSLNFPIVVIVAGSGPTDRNGNSIAGVYSNSYKIFADSLLKHGIASLRFDKRGVGKSVKALTSEKDLRYDDYIDDVVVIVKWLKTNFSTSPIIIAGHSEGALIGLIAAKKTKADKYISIAGTGEPIQNTLKEQFKTALPDSLRTIANLCLDTLAKGKMLNYVPPALFALFRPSVQPYMINWMKYNPQNEIKKHKKPMLIINGTHDIQVKEANAIALKKANKKAHMLIVPGMSHLLKQAPADRTLNAATYTKDKDKPVDALFVKEVVSFINN